MFDNWPDCQEQVFRYSGAKFKSFPSYSEANDFVNYHNGGQSFYKSGESYESESENQIVDTPIYVDGAARRNGRRDCVAGYGVYFGKNDPRNISEPLRGKQSNQRAELMAVHAALAYIEKHLPIHGPSRKFAIHTDSKYSMRCVTEWVHKWRTNGWQTSVGGDVLNKDLIEACAGMLGTINAVYLRNRMGELNFYHVPGHQGIEGNEEADNLANLGADRNEGVTYYI